MPRKYVKKTIPGDVGIGAATIELSSAQTACQIGVLVVDDDKSVRMLLESGLKRHGFLVWLAATGRDALDLYRDHRSAIAVALLDVQMPGLDGPGTLDALRELEPELPACFMSGNTAGYGTDELRQRGAGYVFAKPFLVAVVADALRRLAAREHTEFIPSHHT